MLTTDRLILRPWTAGDRAPFAALNADPEVRRYFPSLLSRSESDALIARAMAQWDRDGFAFCAVERRADGAFLGMSGLSRADFDPPVGDCVEIGWRLAREHWGKGYATEAARAWLRHGFETLRLDEIVAFTVPENAPSLAVMRRLGMRRDPARDFRVPSPLAGAPSLPHVLYALARPE